MKASGDSRLSRVTEGIHRVHDFAHVDIPPHQIFSNRASLARECDDTLVHGLSVDWPSRCIVNQRRPAGQTSRNGQQLEPSGTVKQSLKRCRLVTPEVPRQLMGWPRRMRGDEDEPSHFITLLISITTFHGNSRCSTTDSAITTSNRSGGRKPDNRWASPTTSTSGRSECRTLRTRPRSQTSCAALNKWSVKRVEQSKVQRRNRIQRPSFAPNETHTSHAGCRRA